MGAKTSKTLVIEDQNIEEFKEVTQEMRVSAVHASRLSAIYIPLVLFLSTMATAIVLVRGGRLTMENGMMLGTLSAFLSYACLLYTSPAGCGTSR